VLHVTDETGPTPFPLVNGHSTASGAPSTGAVTFSDTFAGRNPTLGATDAPGAADAPVR
jgi:hypothetical protein